MPRFHALLIGVNHYTKLENANLRGCVNDARLIRGLLVDQFAFDPESIVMLLDTEASRDAILEQMEIIAGEVAEDDLVLLFFAGHGSRLVSPSGDQPTREAIMPSDTGRGIAPNTDILDFEIDAWVQRVNKMTRFVTLVMDCCHSGSVTRDPFGERTRSFPADPRGFEAWVGVESRPSFVDSARHDEPQPGFVSGYRHAVVMAACRAAELAWEYRWLSGETVERNGAFTFFLGRELARAKSDTTWRELFEVLAPRVNREYSSQHPLLEGRADDLFFGRKQVAVGGYLPVVSVDPDEIVLGGGVAHGVRAGSRWEVHTTSSQGADAEPLGVTVTRVDPTTCIARPDSEIASDIVPGNRAFLTQDMLEPELWIHLRDTDGPGYLLLKAALEAEELLSITDDSERAEIQIQRLPKRSRVEDGDPCPDLGPLAIPQWAAVGADGSLAIRLHPETDHINADIESLVRDLIRLARFRNILQIENPSRPYRDQILLRVRSQTARGRSKSFEESDPLFREGDLVDFEIHNRSDSDVYFTLLELGTDYEIKLLAPFPGHPTVRAKGLASRDGGIPLAAGETFSILQHLQEHPKLKDQVREGLRLQLPAGFPWATKPSADGAGGRIYLKLMLTSAPTDFGFFAQPGARAIGDHPLQRLALLGLTGQGSRSFTPDKTATSEATGWDTLTLAMGVKQ